MVLSATLAPYEGARDGQITPIGWLSTGTFGERGRAGGPAHDARCHLIHPVRVRRGSPPPSRLRGDRAGPSARTRRAGHGHRAVLDDAVARSGGRVRGDRRGGRPAR